MKIFIYGMQSSGASFTILLLAQIQKSLAVVDLFNREVAPSLNALDDIQADQISHVMLKAVITSTHCLDDHIKNFQPDKKILLLRHPYHNYLTLTRKGYSAHGGDPDEKFRQLENLFINRANLFDATILYEELAERPGKVISQLQKIGIQLEKSAFEFPRSPKDVIVFNNEKSSWCRENYEKRWGMGNIHAARLKPELIYKYVPNHTKTHVKKLCPELTCFFDSEYAKLRSPGSRLSAAVWHDVIIRNFKRLKRRLRSSVGSPKK